MIVRTVPSSIELIRKTVSTGFLYPFLNWSYIVKQTELEKRLEFVTSRFGLLTYIMSF